MSDCPCGSQDVLVMPGDMPLCADCREEDRPAPAVLMLYLLEWFNGLDYEDQETYLLGVYTSAEARAAARLRYQAARRWPLKNDEADALFVEYEAVADDDFYLPEGPCTT